MEFRGERGERMAKRETKEERKKRVRKIVARLKKKYPRARTALEFSSPHELLVATVLSAQCTDKKVNAVTKELFKKYRSVDDFAKADRKTLEKEIKPTGFFRMKAKSVIELSQDILDKFGGRVPDNLDDLVKLRGVGRKTANVVLAGAFGKPAIAVDTHVKRVAARLGLSRKKDPTRIEFDLMEIVPKKDWAAFSFMIILHGREVCKARKPLCHICVIEDLCPSSAQRKGRSRKT